MASAYSIVRQYGNYIQPYDFQLLQAGLQYKQNKFDANLFKIQSQIDQFAKLDLVKAEDKQYLNDRITNIVNRVNSYGGVDLSSNGVTTNINNLISESIDEKVLKAYSSSLKFRNLQKNIENVKKNNPKAYSSINEAYALREASDWINDGEVGSEYKGGNYHNFVDVRGKLDKSIGDLRKNRPEQVVTIPDVDASGNPTGYTVTKKVKELTAEEIRSVASKSLSAEDQKQIQINGWYNFGQVSPDETKKYLETYKNERYKILDGEIAHYNLLLGSASGVEKSQIRNQIQLLNNEKNRIEDSTSSLDATSEAIGSFLERETVINNVIEKHKFKQASTEYKNDQSYWNRINHNYKVAKDQRDYEFKVNKENYNRQFDILKLESDERIATEKVRNSRGSSRSRNAKSRTDIDPFEGLVSLSTKTPEEQFEKPKTYVEYIDEIESNENTYLSKAKDIISRQEQSVRDDFNKILTAEKVKPENKETTEDELFSEVFRTYHDNGANTRIVYNPDELDQILDLEETIDSSKYILSESLPTVDDIKDEDWEEFFNFNQKYREKYPFNTYEELKNNKDGWLKDFKADAMADLLWSTTSTIDKDAYLTARRYGKYLFESNSISNFYYNVAKNKARDYSQRVDVKSQRAKFDYYVENISQIYGEDVKFNDVFKIINTVDRHGIEKSHIELRKQVDKPSNTYNQIKFTFKDQGFDIETNLFGGDSFNDNSKAKELLGYKSRAEALSNNLEEFSKNQPDNKKLVFSKDSPFHQSLGSALSGGVKVGDVDLDFKPTKPISVQRSSDGFLLSQDSSDGKSTSKISVEDLTKLIGEDGVTRLGEVVDESTLNDSNYISTAPPVTRRVKSFKDSEKDYNFFESVVVPTFLSFPEEMNKVDKTSAKKQLKEKYVAYLTEDDKPTVYSQLIDKVMDDPSKFKVIAESGVQGKEGIVKVVYEDRHGDGNVISLTRMNAITYRNERNLVKKTPEVYIYDMLDSIITTQINYQKSGEGRYDKFNELLKLYF